MVIDEKDKARKRAIFLQCAGREVQDIFDTIEETDENVVTACKKVQSILSPRNILCIICINPSLGLKSSEKKTE